MTKRNEKIDFYKGILILGVIWGHMITALSGGADAQIVVWIHRFFRTYDMPMFIFIAGFFLQKTLGKYNWWKYNISKAGHILLPVILWNAIFYFLKAVLVRSFSFTVLLKSCTGLWFLWATFFCSVIVITIKGIFKKDIFCIPLLVVAALVFYLISTDTYNMAYMFPFFVFGFYFEKTKKLVSHIVNWKTIQIISFFVFVLSLCFWSSKYNVWNAGSYILENTAFVLKSIAFRFIIGVSGCIAMKNIMDILYKMDFDWLKNNIITFGKNTLMLYIFQSFAVEYLLKAVMTKVSLVLGYNPLTAYPSLVGYFIAPVLTFVFIFVLLFIIKLLKQIPIINKFVFGNKLINANI